MKEVEGITAGTFTGSKRCPGPFALATPRFAASSLRNSAINRDKANGLFRNVVGGLDVRRRGKLKVGLSSLAKTRGHIVRLLHLWRRRRSANLRARLALIGQSSMFVDANRFLDDLDLLECVRRFIAWQQSIPAGETCTDAVFPRSVKHVERKPRTFVSRMPLLSALLPFSASPCAFGCCFVRLNDITRRWVRGGGRILLRLGQLFLERFQLLCERHSLLIGDQGRERFAVRTASFFHLHGQIT